MGNCCIPGCIHPFQKKKKEAMKIAITFSGFQTLSFAGKAANWTMELGGGGVEREIAKIGATVGVRRTRKQPCVGVAHVGVPDALLHRAGDAGWGWGCPSALRGNPMPTLSARNPRNWPAARITHTIEFLGSVNFLAR